ncbi:MAG: sialidase family protein [Candidatus Bipolaricaulia bacterium]
MKSFWKWAVALILPALFVFSSFSSDLAQGQAQWATVTIGQAGAKAGSWWFSSDFAFSERDPATADDDSLYITSTALLGQDWLVFLHVSKDGGATWTKYVVKLAGDVVIGARVKAASYKDGDVVCVGWQDWEVGEGIPEIVAQCFWAPKPTVENLPDNPQNMPSEGALVPAEQIEANDLYSPDPAPQAIIPLAAEPTNLSNTPDTNSGVHDIGTGDYVGQWDLGINPHSQCATNGFPLIWAVWSEDYTKLLYSRSTNGQSWEPAQAFKNKDGQEVFPDSYTRFPSAYADKDGVMYAAVAQAIRPPDVFVSASTDCGQTWGELANLSQNSGFSDGPFVAVTADGAIHTVNDDDTTNPDNADIHHNRCTREGNAITCAGGSQPIAKDGGFPYIATDGKQALYVSYSSHPGGKLGGVGFVCSTDGGQTWSASEEIPNSTIGSPTIRFTDLGALHWQEKIAVNTQNMLYLVWVQWIRGQAIKLQLSKRTPAC